MQIPPPAKIFGGGYLAKPRFPRGRLSILHDVATTICLVREYLHAHWSGLINLKSTNIAPVPAMAQSRRIGLQLHHAPSTAKQTAWPIAGEDDDPSDEDVATPTTGKHNDGPPTLFHRFRHDKSILALAVTSAVIYAGTQSGEILVSCDACSKTYSQRF